MSTLNIPLKTAIPNVLPNRNTRKRHKTSDTQVHDNATPQSFVNQRSGSIASAAPSPSWAPEPKPIIDNETAILRKYDRHFDTATSMMEELHQKRLEVTELQNFLQRHDIQQIIAKMDELRDVETKIHLAFRITHEIPLAMGAIAKKGWENFKILGYARPAGATSPVKRSPSVNLSR